MQRMRGDVKEWGCGEWWKCPIWTQVSCLRHLHHPRQRKKKPDLRRALAVLPGLPLSQACQSSWSYSFA